MTSKHSRMVREEKTVEAMINIYCRAHHGMNKSLCTECGELLAYALKRLDKCPFQEKKTSCGNCKIHCYKPDMREKVRTVMKYAGPRMLRRHPVLAVLHILDGFRREAGRPEGRTKSS